LVFDWGKRGADLCGRFVQFSSLRTLERHFQLDIFGDEWTASYNVAPTQEILAITHENGRRLGKFHWGLVPPWSKDLSRASRLINARAETVAQKPSFRAAFKKRRCLILSDGFYEWKGEKGSKQPYFLYQPDKKPFAFAGLWEAWKPEAAAENQSIYYSCTIITREASSSIRTIHHRMPVILLPRVYDHWLDPGNQQGDELQDILDQHHVREISHFPVSKMVNRVQNNSPELIRPVPVT
jgi:putative SOS response-associated peptidase YedK